MNKKLITVAIAAGLAVPMAASAEVTVGGALQAELASWNYGDPAAGDPAADDSATIEDNKRGRLWIKGSEDLSGGLKALYHYQWQVDTADGNAPDVGDGHTNARAAYVGLKGGFGSIMAGRLYSPYKYTFGTDYNKFTTSVLEGRGNGGALKEEGTMSKAYGINSFLSNAVAYKGKFGITQVWALYQFSEKDYRNDNIAVTVKVKVMKGLSLGAGYISEDAGTATTNEGGTRIKLAGNYKVGMHDIYARYETQSDDAANSDVTAMFLGYHIKVGGRNTVSVQYGDINGDNNADDSTYTLLAFTHKLSKKTKVWAGYRDTDRDGTADDVSVLAAGMRVGF